MAGWMLFGYKALRVYDYKDYFIIEPTIGVDLEDCGMNYYTIEIHEEQVYHIANSVGVLQLKFYVDKDYVESEQLVHC